LASVKVGCFCNLSWLISHRYQKKTEVQLARQDCIILGWGKFANHVNIIRIKFYLNRIISINYLKITRTQKKSSHIVCGHSDDF
ncbi:hypothetical protein, partial [Bacillus subtilis]|uniref:hypothetical protein n=1 Tax=Bacillus subtilis TaxID=1423 RepID=UPI001BCB1944